MKKLISFDIFADFGMLKKPDTNEPMYLTFNMMHKPALLGILGAISGQEGFKEKGKLPAYYLNLKDLPVGIQPLRHENGNYQKTIVTYSNSTGTASKEQGGNLIVSEQTLIAPAFRGYLLLDTQNDLHNKLDTNLENFQAEYIPYLGKNECSVWWENYQSYQFEYFEPEESFKIASAYIKDEPVEGNKVETMFLPVMGEDEGNTFTYFERLPIGYDETMYQYDYRDFAFTDWTLEAKSETSNQLLKTDQNEIIQVF